jgi:hypothetical protein
MEVVETNPFRYVCTVIFFLPHQNKSCKTIQNNLKLRASSPAPLSSHPSDIWSMEEKNSALAESPSHTLFLEVLQT